MAFLVPVLFRAPHNAPTLARDRKQMQPMNHNSGMEPNTMNALAQMNQMNDMQPGSNPMAKMQGMANGSVFSALLSRKCAAIQPIHLDEMR